MFSDDWGETINILRCKVFICYHEFKFVCEETYMAYRSKINDERFAHAMWQLIGRIQQKQRYEGEIAFQSGWLKETEGYKRTLWSEAQRILKFNTWRENNLSEYKVIDKVCQCMELNGQNLLDYHDVTRYKEKMAENKECSERVIFQIFCGTNDSEAFKKATALWGNGYPFISFLFFLKNREKYVTVRPKNMAKKFAETGIESECFSKCTWEHYQEFLYILREVQNKVKKDFDSSAEFIDAHSYIWVMYLLEETDTDILAEQLEKIDKEKTVDPETEQQSFGGDTRDAIVKVRVNQSEFRTHLLQRYGKCCLCGVSNHDLLIASHIKPWSKSNRIEKTAVDNGFLLCPNHDRLFDKGLITFSDDGKI